MICPRCGTALQKASYANIICFHCPQCHGVAVTVSGLRTMGVEPENVYSIWASANAGKLGVLIPCPECGDAMRITKLDNGGDVFYIDVCTRCQMIWFDFGELDKIPVVPLNRPEVLPPQAREVAAISSIRDLDSESASPPTLLENLGIDQLWCGAALRLLLRLIFRI